MKKKNRIKIIILSLILVLSIFLIFYKNYFYKMENSVYFEDINKNTAIDFSLKNLAGETIILSGINSEFYLINFWAIKCPYCIMQIEDLVDLSDMFSEKKLTVLGISLDSDIKDIKSIKNQYKIPYTMLISDDFTPWKFGGISGVPVTFLLNSNRELIKKYIGLTSKQKIIQDLKK